MKEIQVNLGVNSYKICIGVEILEKLGDRLKKLDIGNKCVIVTNPIVNQLYGVKIVRTLEKNNFKVMVLEVPDGEKQKSLKYANNLYNELITNNIDRKSCIVALGGGVIGDLAGFIASTYQRGLPFIQVPTTLLAQVDSSIGGKVAVNHPLAKNMIGSFYQPKLVWIDIETLRTLPDRELKSGLAEVIKYAMIADSKLFCYLKKNILKLKKYDTTVLSHLISESCRIKKNIVEQDERENSIRTILNYGHTFGHAIENISNYQLRHGEAVSIGMICAAEVSERLGILNKEIVEEQEELIREIGLPTFFSQKTIINDIIKKMELDKKKLDDKLRLVLPTSIGQVSIQEDVSVDIIKKILEKHIMESNAKICVCIAENNQNETKESIKKAVESGADIIELRLDLTEENLDLKELIESCRVPIITTDRKNKDNLIQGIESGCDYVDVELETNKKIRDELVKKAKNNRCKVIISMHDYQRTPSYSKLLNIVHREKNAGANIGKIVTMANSLEDCHRLLKLSIDAKKMDFPLLIFAMGNVGRFTRVIAPMLGSPFTYASIGDEIEPGQLSINSLNNIYKELTL